MFRKLNILTVILIVLFAFTGCGEKQVQHYDGVINVCEKINDEEVILLYHNTITADKTKPPVYEDTLSIYNIKTKENKFLLKDNDIWTSYDNQIKIKEDSIVYSEGVKITEFSKTNTEWQRLTADYSTTSLKMISPSGSKYVNYEDGFLR